MKNRIAHKLLSLKKNALNHIISHQNKNGSFFHLSSPDEKNFTDTKTYISPFMTSFILSCLLSVSPRSARLQKTIHQSADFLLREKSDTWTWNYWSKTTPEYKSMPYPDDLDDTSCVLAALHQYNPTLIDGKALAHIITVLTTLESQEGGPYRTWVVPPHAEEVWKDVDLAVNCNIAYFLSFFDITLPHIVSMVEEAIQTNTYTSRYYPSAHALFYFIARWYQGPFRDTLIDHILSQYHPGDMWGNPLNNALCLTSLMRLGYTDDKHIHTLMSFFIEERQNKPWKPYHFFPDPYIERQKYFAGASTITAAFCVETLNTYTTWQKEKGKRRLSSHQKEKEDNTMHTAIRTHMHEIISQFPFPLQKYMKKVATRIEKNDSHHHIFLTPYFFWQSLRKKNPPLSDDDIVQFGAANVSGWMAYTIYDDFFDQEGDPLFLSVANASLRTFAEIYRPYLSAYPSLRPLFFRIMNTIDNANIQEIEQRKVFQNENILLQHVPKDPESSLLRSLSDKSLGHALGAVSIMCMHGLEEQDMQLQNILALYQYLLAAKQLNDDLHDWESDLKRGHITYVIQMILNEYKKQTKGKTRISLRTHIPHLQKIFWYTSIEQGCELLDKLIQEGKRTLTRCHFIHDPTYFNEQFTALEKMREKTKTERQKALDFIHIYTEDDAKKMSE